MSYQVGLLPPETLAEALGDLARHEAVGGWKALAAYMNTAYADDPEEAGKWLHRALNPKNRDVLHDRHIDRAIQKGREVGCHVLYRFKCELWGYEQGKPINGKSKRLTLLEEDARLAARRAEIQRELEAQPEEATGLKLAR